MGFWDLGKELKKQSKNISNQVRRQNKTMRKQVKKQNQTLNKEMDKQNKAMIKAMNFYVKDTIRKEKRVPIPAKRRKEVYEKFKKKCHICTKRKPLEIHHKNLKNSDNRLANLRLLCCNHHTLEHQKHYKKKYKK